LVTRLVSRIRTTLDMEPPVRAVFELPTVSQLAERLQTSSSRRPPLSRAIRPERLPLSYGQQRLWFVDRLQGGSSEYNRCEATRLRGTLDISSLHHAIATIIGRHEILRTNFGEIDGEPVQVIAPSLNLEIEC